MAKPHDPKEHNTTDVRMDKSERQRVENFLIELAALTAEYNLVLLAGCTCCGGMMVHRVQAKDSVGEYAVQREEDGQKDRHYRIKFRQTKVP